VLEWQIFLRKAHLSNNLASKGLESAFDRLRA